MKLVTVVELAQLPVDGNNQPRGYAAAATTNNDDRNSDGNPTNNGVHGDDDDNDNDNDNEPRTRFFIRGQEDHYQVEEFLKFVAPWGGAPFWVAWQLFGTLLCVLGVLLWPFSLVRTANSWRRERRQRLKNS